jgi:hypothetical protein
MKSRLMSTFTDFITEDMRCRLAGFGVEVSETISYQAEGENSDPFRMLVWFIFVDPKLFCCFRSSNNAFYANDYHSRCCARLFSIRTG